MKRFIILAAIACLTLIVVLILSSPLASIEEQVTSLKYRIRGEQQADTNIIIVYLDNEAIKELGWPVRRNFHALMISALSDLKAKAVGVDILFENPSLEYPEYDQLLAGIVGDARNVVLSSYFDKLVLSGWKLARIGYDEVPFAGDDLAQLLDLPLVSDIYRLGDGLHLPMQDLVRNAAGIGHVNIEEDGRIPLFVASDQFVIPSLGTDVLRVYSGVRRNALRFEHNRLALRREGKLLEIDTDDGKVQLNFPGRISSFTLYPFLEVLKSYDALRSGQEPSIHVQNFKNKIILIGAIAEGRTETFPTPVDPRFPSLGLHAVFLDNALRSGFLITPSWWIVSVLSLLIGYACAASVLELNSAARWYLPVALIMLTILISVGSFLLLPFVLPIVPLIVAGIFSTTAALLYKHRFVHEKLRNVLTEKELIATQLQDREAKVAALERELVSLEKNKSTERNIELLEEIRRYKAEIHALTSRKDDLEEAPITVPTGEPQSYEGIVFEAGGPMQGVIEFVRKIAASDATVLILGESGTGKEMVARAMHKHSGRTDKAFVAVNCSALAENLLESELFGHEKGAFTGAVKDKAGRFELADGGTIFLDEIGEVNEAFQLKLLRVLQEGEFERVGGTKTVKVNVRVIAATNKDLKQEVKQKRFREDLFYRLNVLSVELPPLRERQRDIPLLVQYFIEKEHSGLRISKNVLDILQNHAWRGNIRELESAIKRAVLLAKAEKRTMISMKDLPGDITVATKGMISLEDHILESLREKKFSRSAISETADELGGLNRGTVAEYLRGQCLKAFVEHTYNLDTAVRYISLSSDSATNERVRKKLQEYLANIAEAVDADKPWEGVKPALKSKMKNLPLKYQPTLEQIAEAYYRRVWNVEA